ncbi:MAG: hypothetical protein OEM49_09275 [Myxococcales bacterium]|nr:hypothetical protein [Myxococcales bacterium]MDH5306800.1 hypothetical protein [Myxococcales bacterium]MDH5567077.1 hypothetical protein [Myxococcales bacterium]
MHARARAKSTAFCRRISRGIQLRATALGAAAFAAIVIGTPQLARACSVCTAGRDEESRFAFILTTAFMTILPLVLIGGVVWWLRSRVRAHESAAISVSGAPDASTSARAARI